MPNATLCPYQPGENGVGVTQPLFRKRTLKEKCIGFFKTKDKLSQSASSAEIDSCFWNTFYKAYTALCTPVIVGEINRKTLDVIVVYANHAAEQITGYNSGHMTLMNPDGFIGRSVTDLMTKTKGDAHAGYVAGWLFRQGVISAQSCNSIRPAESSGNDDMQQVEGISRRVELMTKDGTSLNVDASLSFFTTQTMKKVVGIFSFKSAEELNVLSFDGLVFNILYLQPGSDDPTYVCIKPPTRLSEFDTDSCWNIAPVSNDIPLTMENLDEIRRFVRRQIFYHLGRVSVGSRLDITFAEKKDKTSLSEVDIGQIVGAMSKAINESKSDANMFFAVSSNTSEDRYDICSVNSEGDGM